MFNDWAYKTSGPSGERLVSQNSKTQQLLAVFDLQWTMTSYLVQWGILRNETGLNGLLRIISKQTASVRYAVILPAASVNKH